MPKTYPKKAVLDASLIAKLLTKETDSSKTISLFENLLLHNIEVIVPNFLKIELYSVIRKKTHLNQLTAIQATQSLQLLNLLPLNYYPLNQKLLDRSFKIATKLKQTVIYDSLYLALAQY